MLNQRAANLLQVILSSRLITIRQLEKELNCTRRQVNYDLQKVNNWLRDQNLSPIENSRDQGLVVNQKIKSEVYQLLPKVNMANYIPSQEERIKIIFMKLFIKKEYLSVNHLTGLLKMSRNTVLTYIQLLKVKSNKVGVELTYNRKGGYELLGSEFDIRAVAFKNISSLLQLPNGMNLLEKIYDYQVGEGTFQEIYQKIYESINNIEENLEVSFVDEKLKELTVFFIFLFTRVSGSKKDLFAPDVKKKVKNLDVYQAAKSIMKTLRIEVSEDELTYVAMHLLGLNTSYGDELLNTNQSNELYRIIDQIIIDFEKLACVAFTDRESAKNSLFMHLRPAYHRMLFKIPITNPYLEKIKEEHFDLFILVKKSLRKFEQLLNCPVSDDEVGYISLHIGAFLKNQGLPYRRRRCMIICPNGLGTSYMLKNQFEKLIPEVEVAKVTSPREYKTNSESDIDFILSTVPIQVDKPLIVVEPILTELDKAKIIQEVDLLLHQKQSLTPDANNIMQVVKLFTIVKDEQGLYKAINEILMGRMAEEIGRYKPMLNQLLPKEMIQLTDSVENWQEAIRLAAKPLLDEDAIDERYIEAMIENIQKIGPYIVMAPKVAIPHARPEDGVRKIGMSLLKIDCPVSFLEGDAEKDVNLVFVIAAIDNEMHLKALSQLTELIEESSVIDQLLNAKSSENIIPFIEEYSNKN